MSWNTVHVDGKIDNEPKMRKTPSGTTILELRIAHSERRTSGSEVQIFDVSVWARYAETLAPFLFRGTHVVVEGKLSSAEWIDRAGIKQRRTEVQASSLRIVAERVDQAQAPKKEESPPW